PMELPTLHLDHLRHLTDDLGILQHAVYTVPNYAEGYTTDDNARALIVFVLLEEASGSGIPETRWLTSRYLAFLLHAFNRAAGRFRNTLSIDRRWQEEVGSEDCHARALWAVGVVVGRSSHEGLVGPAHGLFDAALLPALEFTSPRAWAFVLFGLQQYLQRFPGDRRARGAREALVQRLLDAYRQYRAPDWHWFEDVLAYANASLPYALIECGQAMEHGEAVEIGLAALEWLADLQRSPHGHFVPIGSNGFYRRGGDRARFDQQPIEAQATVSACLAAYTQTGARRWREEAERAFEWFLGRNDLGMELYDPVTGGCRDGLHPDGVNQNQGAESTLAFLHALLEMRLAEHIVRPFGGVRRDDAALVPESVGDRR
ncbi:MAG: glycosyl transferase family 1, partial [Armatimonadetes bacterium]|nr:glycosyl transferase family 1 [Armatimonadota bacterium]